MDIQHQIVRFFLKGLGQEIESLKAMIESTWELLETDPQQDNHHYIQDMNLTGLYPLAIQHLKCATPTERGQLSMAGANIHCKLSSFFFRLSDVKPGRGRGGGV